jgi:hypothetical protein
MRNEKYTISISHLSLLSFQRHQALARVSTRNSR